MSISLLCAVCGRDTAVDMELFGHMKADSLREFFELPHRIPYHDAYSRLFRVMKPIGFQAFFDKFRAKGGGETLALRELIQMLDIRGISITANALHCQRETCELIVQQDGDYCLQLKGNQGEMLIDVRAFVGDESTDYTDKYHTIDADHDRIEERSYNVYNVPEYLINTHK